MKLSIISDTHFGDDSCLLVTNQGSSFVEGQKYKDLVDAAGKENDYLVLAGDVFDFSIKDYATAYAYGQYFFQRIKQDGIAKEVIYLAGNHDFDMWNTVQYQRSIIKRIGSSPQQGKPFGEFQHSVAGIIDDRQASAPGQRGLMLNGVTRNAGGQPYGGMFLDNISNPPTSFSFAYPNLYIVTDNESVLVTHGQYLELFWAIVREIGLKLAYDDLKVGEVDVEETVEMNFPLNQLACTGVGQAGVLTNVVRQVQLDVKGGRLGRVEKYLTRLKDEIDGLTHFGWIKEWIEDYLLGKAKDEVLNALGSIEQTRYSDEFIHKPAVKERFMRFYNSSRLELANINVKTNLAIPAPWRVIFGHTHQPIAWNDPDAPKLGTVSSSLLKPLVLSNAGGWIVEDNKFCGAEVFTYETGRGFGSVPIR